MPRPTVAILSSVHDVGDARIHRHAAALAAAGFDVEVWGTGDAALAPPAATVVAAARVGLVRRFARALALPWRTSARVLISVDPDVAFACRLRTALPRGRVHVADVHEDFEALLRDRGWAHGLAALPGRCIAVLGRRAAERADLTAVADDHLVPAAKNRVVVRNVPALPPEVMVGPRARAVYVGDVRASRGVYAMLEAIEAAPQWEFDVVGPVAPADVEHVTEFAGRLGARVRLHGRLSPTESWGIARGAWAGFVMLDATPAFVAATPSKLYEYLAHGIPVIATPLPGHVAILEQSHGGEVAADAATAAELLNRWGAHPERVAELSRNGRAWAERSEFFAQGSDELAAKIGQIAL